MATRDWRIRIEHMLEAIAKIGRYTRGLTYDELSADEEKVDAVLRNFITIGEAVRHVPDEVRARYASVPWRLMVDMRNVVIHAYPDVDLGIVWDTMQNDLPTVAPLLREILEREP